MKDVVKDAKIKRAAVTPLSGEWLVPRIESVMETVDYGKMNAVMGYYNIIKITKSAVMDEPVIALSEEVSELGSLEPRELKRLFLEKQTKR